MGELDVTPKTRPSTTQLGTDMLMINTITGNWTLQINELDAGGKSICRFQDVSGSYGQLVGADKAAQINSGLLRVLGKAKLIEAAQTDEELKQKLVDFGLIESE